MILLILTSKEGTKARRSQWSVGPLDEITLPIISQLLEAVLVLPIGAVEQGGGDAVLSHAAQVSDVLGPGGGGDALGENKGIGIGWVPGRLGNNLGEDAALDVGAFVVLAL